MLIYVSGVILPSFITLMHIFVFHNFSLFHALSDRPRSFADSVLPGPISS